MSEGPSFAGRTAFITGGGGGLGSALARACARRGMAVALADMSLERADAVARQLGETGAQARAIQLDVTSLSSWASTVEEAQAELGPIAVLANNAGIASGGVVAESDPDKWRAVMEVNAMGPYYGCRTVLPHMLRQQEQAYVINIASLSGLRSDPTFSSYCASKHALVGMTDSLRGELLRTNVHVSLVYPGMIDTNFTANSANALEGEGAAKSHQANPMSELLKSGMNPENAGEHILRNVLKKKYHIFTHPEWKEILQQHYEERLDAFGDSADPDYRDDIETLTRALQPAD